MDVNSKGLVDLPEHIGDPEFRPIDRALRKDLTEADRERLWDWFLAEKVEIIETTPISEIDISDLPVVEDGQMASFAEVFPFGLCLKFPLGNEVWVVDELYCVTPKCKCSEAALNFIKLAAGAREAMPSHRESKAIYYNYRSKTFCTAYDDKDGPSCKELLAALSDAHPNLNLRIAQHHEILQNLYKRMRLEETKRLAEEMIPEPMSKVGRNEPCPCGSGKKYKQCCLK